MIPVFLASQIETPAAPSVHISTTYLFVSDNLSPTPHFFHSLSLSQSLSLTFALDPSPALSRYLISHVTLSFSLSLSLILSFSLSPSRPISLSPFRPISLSHATSLSLRHTHIFLNPCHTCCPPHALFHFCHTISRNFFGVSQSLVIVLMWLKFFLMRGLMQS